MRTTSNSIWIRRSYAFICFLCFRFAFLCCLLKAVATFPACGPNKQLERKLQRYSGIQTKREGNHLWWPHWWGWAPGSSVNEQFWTKLHFSLQLLSVSKGSDRLLEEWWLCRKMCRRLFSHNAVGVDYFPVCGFAFVNYSNRNERKHIVWRPNVSHE